MRTLPLFLALAPLAACTATDAVVDDRRATQEAACAAAIATHIARPVSEVTARRLSEAGGVAEVEAIDGDRLHICRVDGSGRVLGYTHPRGD